MTIEEFKQHTGETISLHGWVHAIREHKRMRFLVVRTTGTHIQCTIDSLSDETLGQKVAALTRESTVRIAGRVVENQSVGLGGLEIHVTELDILTPADPVLPIDPSSPTTSGVDARMDWRFVDLRRPESRLIFEVQTEAEWAMRAFWREEQFIEIHTPKLMATASESGAELFGVDYFGGQAYLAQSPQFYKQMAMASGFNRVFEVAPVFRANPSFTSRHDTEFTSVDVEISWIESHEDVMQLEERWLTHVLAHLHDTFAARVSDTFGVDIVVPSLPFPRISMQNAIEICGNRGYQNEREGDLDPGGEREVFAHVKETYDHEFVFITDYPFSVRPFYHMRHPEGERLTKSFDLLWKGLEVTTGAQREHRLPILERQAEEKGLSPEHIRFYLDFFKFGCPPHGGFGFGLTRMLMVLLGLPAVRETTFLTRTPNRLSP